MPKKPILYAEDDKDDAYFMERAFNQAGLANELIIVPDGEQVQDYLRGAGKFTERDRYPLPCLVLLDLNMPGLSGLEILKWIRTHPAVSTIPVVVLTSSSHASDIHRAYAQGVNAYLVKPAHPEKLVDVLKTINAFWLELNQPPPDPNRFVSKKPPSPL
jgi:CheY-like chemotaxis protein